VIEQELAHGGVVGYLRLPQALDTVSGQPDEQAARVGWVRGPLDELLLDEFVDGAGERLPRSPWNFGDGGPVVIVTQ